MSSSIRSGFSRTRSVIAWFISLTAVACAVATEPDDPSGDEPTGGAQSSAGSSSQAGTPAIAGTPSTAFGGTTSETGGTTSTTTGGTSGGVSAAAGSISSGGKGGFGSGGKGGGTSGKGGSGGMTTDGSGGGGTGCNGLKAWKGGDSTLSIAAGEVVQWMGKRYKATQSIAYPNTECAPDKPVDWCKDWFTPDGDC